MYVLDKNEIYCDLESNMIHNFLTKNDDFWLNLSVFCIENRYYVPKFLFSGYGIVKIWKFLNILLKKW